MRAAFAGNDVRAGVGQDFIARPAMHEGGRDVAHRPRRHEHGRFLAKQAGNALAQQIYRGIIADLLVANFRPRHRLAHRGCRARLRVRQQVDTDGLGLGIARGRGVVHGVLSGHIVCRSHDKSTCQVRGVKECFGYTLESGWLDALYMI